MSNGAINKCNIDRVQGWYFTSNAYTYYKRSIENGPDSLLARRTDQIPTIPGFGAFLEFEPLDLVFRDLFASNETEKNKALSTLKLFDSFENSVKNAIINKLFQKIHESNDNAFSIISDIAWRKNRDIRNQIQLFIDQFTTCIEDFNDKWVSGKGFMDRMMKNLLHGLMPMFFKNNSKVISSHNYNTERFKQALEKILQNWKPAQHRIDDMREAYPFCFNFKFESFDKVFRNLTASTLEERNEALWKMVDMFNSMDDFQKCKLIKKLFTMLHTHTRAALSGIEAIAWEQDKNIGNQIQLFIDQFTLFIEHCNTILESGIEIDRNKNEYKHRALSGILFNIMKFLEKKEVVSSGNYDIVRLKKAIEKVSTNWNYAKLYRFDVLEKTYPFCEFPQEDPMGK